MTLLDSSVCLEEFPEYYKDGPLSYGQLWIHFLLLW